MSSAERSVVIDAPIEVVFTVVSDPRLNPRWSSMLEATEITSEGPIGAGTTFRATARLLGKLIEEDAVITEFEPNRKACIRTSSGPIPTTGCRLLEPVGAGTRLTQTMEVEIGGFFGVAEPVVLKIGLRQLEADLAALKDLIESGVLPPADAAQ